MKPLTAKELEYIADSLSNEDLLIKQCVAAAAQTPTPAVKQICQQLLMQHKQHYQGLLALLQQHSTIAPKTVEEATAMEQKQQVQTAQQQNQQIMSQQNTSQQGLH